MHGRPSVGLISDFHIGLVRLGSLRWPKASVNNNCWTIAIDVRLSRQGSRATDILELLQRTPNVPSEGGNFLCEITENETAVIGFCENFCRLYIFMHRKETLEAFMTVHVAVLWSQSENLTYGSHSICTFHTFLHSSWVN